jgi:hypothetical protein
MEKPKPSRTSVEELLQSVPDISALNLKLTTIICKASSADDCDTELRNQAQLLNDLIPQQLLLVYEEQRVFSRLGEIQGDIKFAQNPTKKQPSLTDREKIAFQSGMMTFAHELQLLNEAGKQVDIKEHCVQRLEKAAEVLGLDPSPEYLQQVVTEIQDALETGGFWNI